MMSKFNYFEKNAERLEWILQDVDSTDTTKLARVISEFYLLLNDAEDKVSFYKKLIGSDDYRVEVIVKPEELKEKALKEVESWGLEK